MNNEIEQITAGIDWISATMRKDYDNSTQWHTNAVKALESVAKAGNAVAARRLLGFEGLSSGNCFIGENETSYYAQFTGSYANDVYLAIIEPNAHISRIDVQFTVKFREYQPNIAKRAYKDANSSNSVLPTHRRRKLSIIIGSDGGDTCYIGSPSSEQRGRIYNKEVQSEDINYTRCWRYECVFKNDLATNYALSLSNESADHAGYCLATAIQWFAARGVDCSGYLHTRAIVLPIQRTLPTDVERKLAWLESQVKPTIRYLCNLGFRDTLLEQLFDVKEQS